MKLTKEMLDKSILETMEMFNDLGVAGKTNKDLGILFNAVLERTDNLKPTEFSDDKELDFFVRFLLFTYLVRVEMMTRKNRESKGKSMNESLGILGE